MVCVYFRTILIYVFLLIAMRTMGKRQVGELQISELIVTFMLSELAVNPISNPNLPFLHAIVPIILLLCIEVLLSFWMTKWNFLKRLLYGTPTILIRHGHLLQHELAKNRMEIDELLSALRQKGIADFAEVDYAILEENGTVSVFPKAAKRPITPSDLSLQPKESGVFHPIIIDGTIIEHNLSATGHNHAWLRKQMASRKLSINEIFLLTVDDSGSVCCIPKDTKGS